jgi:hypothetical protein
MIALRDSLPLIVLPGRRVMAFERDWLTRALSVAAMRAGHADWWLAAHVSESVHEWLKTLRDRNTMTAASFTRAVREALKVIGYAEIGERFEEAAPYARISLAEIAREAGNGFELAFFSALDARLREVFAAGGSYCELHGMEPCVKLLRRCRHWSSGCDAMRGEIVTFARGRTARTIGAPGIRAGRELFLHVA